MWRWGKGGYLSFNVTKQRNMGELIGISYNMFTYVSHPPTHHKRGVDGERVGILVSMLPKRGIWEKSLILLIIMSVVSARRTHSKSFGPFS